MVYFFPQLGSYKELKDKAKTHKGVLLSLHIFFKAIMEAKWALILTYTNPGLIWIDL